MTVSVETRERGDGGPRPRPDAAGGRATPPPPERTSPTSVRGEGAQTPWRRDVAATTPPLGRVAGTELLEFDAHRASI